jgi:hypothetical protein
MSLMNQPGAGIFTALCEIVVDTATAIQLRRLKREAERAMRDAKREAQLAEQRANERQRTWLRMMQRQARERWSGDASREDARRLLNGRGERRNPLDQRKFRPLDERRFR